MRVLSIDTSSRIATVAALNQDQVLGTFSNLETARHAERLFELVRSALELGPWSLSDVELIATGRGPGSFTGVRVGMAAAKALALAIGVPLVGVVSLEAMAFAARRVHGAVPVVPMIDAKKGEVFAALYDELGREWVPPTAVPVPQVGSWLATLESSKRVSLCGEVAEGLGLDQYPIISHPSCALPGAESVGIIAQRQAPQADGGADFLEPLYVRPPDAQLPRSRQ